MIPRRTRPVVCLDCVTARDRGAFMGNLVHARELARALAMRDDITLRLLVDERSRPMFERPGIAAELVMCAPTWKNKLTDQLVVGRVLARQRPDLYHKPNGQLPLVPIPCRAVVTVADLNFKRLDVGLLPRAYKEIGYLRTMRRAAAVVCVSGFTQSEVHHFYPMARTKTTVVLHGTNGFPPATSTITSRLSGRWFLTFGHHRHKNVDVCIEALRVVRAHSPEFADVGLVVVGAGKHIDEIIRPKVQRAGLGASVSFIGWASDADLHGIYRCAAGLLFMSHYEGFGLPLLEAMQVGCPVVASDVCSHPEVTGGAAVLLPPDDATQLASTMIRLLRDPAWSARWRELGVRRASAFSWETAAAQTAAVYAQVLGTSPAGMLTMPRELTRSTAK